MHRGFVGDPIDDALHNRCLDDFVQLRNLRCMERSPEPMPQTPHAEPKVVLKKYGNRRLYDTSASRYVTLVEVEAMVQRGIDIQVIDAKTTEDITREVLVQLLLERDSARASLPTGLLKQAIRLANSPLKEGLVKAMQEGLDTFMSGQRAMLDAHRVLTSSLTPWLQPPTSPASWHPFPPPPAPAPPPPSATMTTTSSTPEIDALRQELGQTQQLVRQLLQRELARTEPVAVVARPRKKPAAKKAAVKKSR